MRRFARRLSQAVVYPISNVRKQKKALPKPSAVLKRPSVASIFYFDNDHNYLDRLGLRRSSSIESEHVEPQTDADKHNADNVDQLARSIKFVSIIYAILLVITGAMCTALNIAKPINIVGNVFNTTCSMLGFGWLVFLHCDILKYKRWVLAQVKHSSSQDDLSNDHSQSGPEDDGMSYTTAYIFNFFQKKQKTKLACKNGETEGYRFFLGKHSNDFYLKIGMIIFCFGNLMHLSIKLIQQIYFALNNYHDCQDWSEMLSSVCCLLFSFYQMFMAFKYSNIIINRHKNVARFALMHLIGTAISIWLGSIVDEAIEDYVARKLADHANATHDDIGLITLEHDYHFREHILHEHHCSELAILSSSSMNAIPYLYPFSIEFNIALASVWLMLFFNIGNIHHKAFFRIPGQRNRDEEEEEDDDDDEDLEIGHQRRKSSARGLSMNIDCHSSNRGLFLGLAILLVMIISLIVFFSTIQQSVYTSFAVFTYSIQLAVLTLLCFVAIPFAYHQIHKLDVVNGNHRDNAFTMMDDILILLPIPFYFINHALAAVATFLDSSEEYLLNNHLLAAIDILAILQVTIQSPFIVDGLRRCSDRVEIRFKKPGRELITLLLILNVALWILNTFELKSIEKYQSLHHYFGEFVSMILSHTTLPLMLFYRFHSSVCLSNIWKYAYEKGE